MVWEDKGLPWRCRLDIWTCPPPCLTEKTVHLRPHSVHDLEPTAEFSPSRGRKDPKGCAWLSWRCFAFNLGQTIIVPHLKISNLSVLLKIARLLWCISGRCFDPFLALALLLLLPCRKHGIQVHARLRANKTDKPTVSFFLSSQYLYNSTMAIQASSPSH